jgi:hypothetical protein
MYSGLFSSAVSASVLPSTTSRSLALSIMFLLFVSRMGQLRIVESEF